MDLEKHGYERFLFGGGDGRSKDVDGIHFSAMGNRDDGYHLSAPLVGPDGLEFWLKCPELITSEHSLRFAEDWIRKIAAAIRAHGESHNSG